MKTTNRLDVFRGWFYAAAIYNLLWGCLNVLFPNLIFKLYAIAPPNDSVLWQVVGMFVLVYVPAYWWAGRFPQAYPHFIVIGLLGKLLGPVGFVWSFYQGLLPANFFWIILTNDLIWWPAFSIYLLRAAHAYGGWQALFAGEPLLRRTQATVLQSTNK